MSSDESADTEKSSSRWWIIVLVLFAMVILMCAGPMTWWSVRRSNAMAELQTRRDEIRARGLPIDNESMEAFRYQNMRHDNSERWTSVLEQVSSDAFEQSYGGTPFAANDESDQSYVYGQDYEYEKEVRDFLAQWTELRQEVHRITENPGPIWTEVQVDSYSTLLPHVQSSRSVARLISLEFQDALRRDDREQAFRSIMTNLGVSRSLEREPFLITQLVHLAIEGIALRDLKTAIEYDLLDDQQLGKILEQLKSFDDIGAKIKLAIAGERAMSQPVFDDLSQLGEGVESLPSGFNERPIDALASLDVFAKAEQIEADDLTALLAESMALDHEFQQSVEDAGWLRRMDTIVTVLTVPAISAFGRGFVRSAMETRIAKLAIGLRLYEKRKGAFPGSISELMSADLGVELGPIDPVGGKPFGYKIAAETAELWGFEPQKPGDETPETPPSSSELSADNSQMDYWNWKLRKAGSPKPAGTQ